MLMIINGPGCPVMNPHGAGRLPEPPRNSAYPRAVLDAVDTVLAINPACIRHPSAAVHAGCLQWLPPDLHPELTVLADPGMVSLYVAMGYRCKPLAHHVWSAADTSGILRNAPKTNIDRVVVVGRYADLATQDIVTLTNRHGFILCGTWSGFGGGIPRFSPGGPLYWLVDSDMTMTAGEPLQAPFEKAITGDVPEKLAEQVFQAAPGSVRILPPLMETPDAPSELWNGVLRLTSDRAFADAAMQDMKELSTRHTEALPS